MDDFDDALPAVVTRMKATIRDVDVLTCRLELPFPELERKGFSICLKGMGSSALGRYMAPGFLSSLGNAQHQIFVPSARRGARRRNDDLRARHREREQIAAKLWAMTPNVRRVFIGDVLSEFVSELISEPFSLPVRIAGSQLIVESFQKIWNSAVSIKHKLNYIV